MKATLYKPNIASEIIQQPADGFGHEGFRLIHLQLCLAMQTADTGPATIKTTLLLFNKVTVNINSWSGSGSSRLPVSIKAHTYNPHNTEHLIDTPGNTKSAYATHLVLLGNYSSADRSSS